MPVHLVLTKTVKQYVKSLKGKGCRAEENWTAGVVRVYDEQVCVYTALQKGKKGPWIVRCEDGPNVRWGPGNSTGA